MTDTVDQRRRQLHAPATTPLTPEQEAQVRELSLRADRRYWLGLGCYEQDVPWSFRLVLKTLAVAERLVFASLRWPLRAGLRALRPNRSNGRG